MLPLILAAIGGYFITSSMKQDKKVFADGGELDDADLKEIVLKSLKDEEGFDFGYESGRSYRYKSEDYTAKKSVNYNGEDYTVEFRVKVMYEEAEGAATIEELTVDEIDVDLDVFSKEDKKEVQTFFDDMSENIGDNYAKGGKIQKRPRFDNLYSQYADGGRIFSNYNVYVLDETPPKRWLVISKGITKDDAIKIAKKRIAQGQKNVKIGISLQDSDYMADGGLIKPEKPIEKMTKLELMRFVQKIDPLKNFYPKTTEAGRVQTKTIYEKYLERKSKMVDGGEVKWQDAKIGDSARVKSENKMGVIKKDYGRKFHLKFVDGTEKTYDASELEFIKDEYAEEEIKQKLIKAGYSESDAEDLADEYKQGGSKVPQKVKDILASKNKMANGGYMAKRGDIEKLSESDKYNFEIKFLKSISKVRKGDINETINDLKKALSNQEKFIGKVPTVRQYEKDGNYVETNGESTYYDAEDKIMLKYNFEVTVNDSVFAGRYIPFDTREDALNAGIKIIKANDVTMADGGYMAKGGNVKDKFKGKNSKEVWNNLDSSTRAKVLEYLFLKEKSGDNQYYDSYNSTNELSNNEWDKLPKNIKKEIENFDKGGMAKGGMMGGTNVYVLRNWRDDDTKPYRWLRMNSVEMQREEANKMAKNYIDKYGRDRVYIGIKRIYNR